MKDGVCSACGSKNVYQSLNTSWAQDGISVATLGNKVNEVFPTEAHLCLDCRHLEIRVAEHAAAIFGTGKTLAETVPVSTNWKKVSD